MIDTIRIISPYISDLAAGIIEQKCVKRQGVEVETGELLYEITTGDLEGSYDSRVMLKLRREKWVPGGRDGDPPVLVECPPYVIIECSVHKLLVGHNIYGGPVDFWSSCYFLVDWLENVFALDLPPVGRWQVARVDIAQVFYIDDVADIAPYFRALNACTYPRREVYRFGETGIWAGGSTTVTKIYYKGAEFYKHDRRRLMRQLPAADVAELQNLANHIIRCEVSLKRRKIVYDYGQGAVVDDIDNDYLLGVYALEVDKLLKEGKSQFKIVRDVESVKRRLFGLYSARMASSLLGTWYNFSVAGEVSARNDMSRATFYRHRKLLRDAGVAWVGGQAVAGAEVYALSDFQPLLGDRRRYKAMCQDCPGLAVVSKVC